jgi:hypothetical protein
MSACARRLRRSGRGRSNTEVPGELQRQAGPRPEGLEPGGFKPEPRRLFLPTSRSRLPGAAGRAGQPTTQTTNASTIARTARTAAALASLRRPCCGARARPSAASTSPGTPRTNGSPVQNTGSVMKERTLNTSPRRAGLLAGSPSDSVAGTKRSTTPRRAQTRRRSRSAIRGRRPRRPRCP